MGKCEGSRADLSMRHEGVRRLFDNENVENSPSKKQRPEDRLERKTGMRKR